MQSTDELVMMRASKKGDLYVHQAEADRTGRAKDWNVIATTDLGGHVVERYVYTPYGEVTVHAETGFGGERSERKRAATGNANTTLAIGP